MFKATDAKEWGHEIPEQGVGRQWNKFERHLFKQGEKRGGLKKDQMWPVFYQAFLKPVDHQQHVESGYLHVFKASQMMLLISVMWGSQI